MQLFVFETAPAIWSVSDHVFAARKPLAQFLDEKDAELWAASREAAEALRSGPKKVRLLDALAAVAQRGHAEVAASLVNAA